MKKYEKNIKKEVASTHTNTEEALQPQEGLPRPLYME